MTDRSEIERLRKRLSLLERNATRSGWLLRQMGLKIKNFPRDFSSRFHRSMRKRETHGKTKSDRAVAKLLKGNVANQKLHWVDPAWQLTYSDVFKNDPSSAALLQGMQKFISSPKFDDLISAAISIDPSIVPPKKFEPNHLPPWFDADYACLKDALSRVPDRDYENVVLVPFGKLGGADFVAGILAKALASQGKTLILRTDLPDWERPDWYPESVDAIDISGCIDNTMQPTRMLYSILQVIGAKRLFNVNSRLAFEMYTEYGERLARQFQLFAYYFCSDRDIDGREVGYPVEYFPNLLPHLTGAMLDTAYLKTVLVKRYMLTPVLEAKLHTIYTPAMSEPFDDPIARTQIESQGDRGKPRLLWAGRLDRQKRFDLVVEIAKAMPDIEFQAWGKAVLDEAKPMHNLPDNLTLNPPFKSYDELPLKESDGWLYTAAWDGLPTILIELGAKGLPLVASGVGGVPELVDQETGWCVLDWENPQAYVDAIRDMLSDDDVRLQRAEALSARVRQRHGVKSYDSNLQDLWR